MGRCRSQPLPSANLRARWTRSQYSWLLLALLLATRVGETKAACPKLCECKWRDGKETVACPNASFIDIPRRLDPSTQVLDLTYNNLQIIPRDAFLDAALQNLQKVWLPFCNLKQLERGSFKGLSNLIELDLSDNQIKKVPLFALSDVPGLRELRIARNLLKSLPPAAFSLTPDLIKLDLSKNQITILDTDAFKGLSRLEVLRLGGNLLKTMTIETLRPLVALHGLHLDNNPWHCNCKLRPLREWMLTRNVAEAGPPACDLPVRLRERKWESLGLDEFVCVPSVTAIAPRVLATHGDNVSLACRVETDMDALVTWLLGDRMLDNTTEADDRRYRVLEDLAPDQHTRLSNLTIASADPKDQGTYRCVAENKAGRVETNLTLQVSKEIVEVPLVANNDAYFVGALAGGGILVVIVIVIVSAVLLRRRRLRQRQRRAKEELRRVLTSAGSPSGTHSSSRSQMNTMETLQTEDEEQSVALTQTRQHQMMTEYHSVDTSPLPPEARDKSWIVRGASMNEFVTSTSLEKAPPPAYSGEESTTRFCEHSQEFDPQKGSSTSRVSPHKVAYVEIPKHDPESIEEKTKWMDLAIPAPKSFAKDFFRQGPQQHLEPSPTFHQEKDNTNGGRASLLRSNSSGGSTNFPDLLDLPQTQVSTQMSPQPQLPPTQPQLPPKPQQRTQPCIREVLGTATIRKNLSVLPRAGSANLEDDKATEHFEQQAAQLDRFLQEYKSLHDQLYSMKEYCNSMRRGAGGPKPRVAGPYLEPGGGSSSPHVHHTSLPPYIQGQPPPGLPRYPQEHHTSLPVTYPHEHPRASLQPYPYDRHVNVPSPSRDRCGLAPSPIPHRCEKVPSPSRDRCALAHSPAHEHYSAGGPVAGTARLAEPSGGAVCDVRGIAGPAMLEESGRGGGGGEGRGEEEGKGGGGYIGGVAVCGGAVGGPGVGGGSEPLKSILKKRPDSGETFLPPPPPTPFQSDGEL